MTAVAERVILVHGTYASSEADHGDAWWQVGSQAYCELQARLPSEAHLVGSGEVFRWSGDNSERARSKAAAQLLNYLKPLERAGQPYHLIGHSHGGSVIWSALKLSTLRRRKLPQLRSWSTVGTPFLHQQSRSPWSFVNLAYALGAAVLLVPCIRMLYALLELIFKLASGRLKNGVVIQSEEDVAPVTAILRAPAVKALELAGVPFKPVADGIQVGSFAPETGQSAAGFLLGTVEGWLILGAMVLCVYLTLLFFSFCLGPVSEVLRIVWEKRIEQNAFDRYGDRWLGLWTQDDEAINGLKKTLEFSVSFVGSMVPRERIFVSDLTAVPSRPLLWLAAPVYNRLVRPFLDATIREMVVKAAQGNNRPASQVIAVSPHPLDTSQEAVPPLPDWLSQKILNQADLHAKDIGPKLRVFLSEPSLLVGLEKFGSQLAGKELVHTSYFDHSEVLDLLALNVGEARNRTRPRNAQKHLQLKEWHTEFQRRQMLLIAEHAATSPIPIAGQILPAPANESSRAA